MIIRADSLIIPTQLHIQNHAQSWPQSPLRPDKDPNDHLNGQRERAPRPARANPLKDSPTLSISAGRCGVRSCSSPRTCRHFRRIHPTRMQPMHNSNCWERMQRPVPIMQSFLDCTILKFKHISFNIVHFGFLNLSGRVIVCQTYR